MEEPLHHLISMKSCKWDIYLYISTGAGFLQQQYDADLLGLCPRKRIPFKMYVDKNIQNRPWIWWPKGKEIRIVFLAYHYSKAIFLLVQLLGCKFWFQELPIILWNTMSSLKNPSETYITFLKMEGSPNWDCSLEPCLNYQLTCRIPLKMLIHSSNHTRVCGYFSPPFLGHPASSS